jgi:hypothetical protein
MKTADFGLKTRCTEESFLNWDPMRESDTYSQSYSQNTAAHSNIRLDHDFLPILH